MSGGFTTLELFSDLDEEDLDDLGIRSPQDRVKVLTAAQMLQNYEGKLLAAQALNKDSIFMWHWA